MSDRKTVDLWADRKGRTARKKRKRARKAAQSWADRQPWREGKLGQLHTDPFEVERFIIAMCGESWSRAGDLLKEAIANELAEGRAALRVFELSTDAPCRVQDSHRLSCRSAQIARRALRRHAPGTGALPFQACIPKDPYGPTLSHGALRFSRGIRMSSPSRKQLSVPLSDWSPVPLVIGPSDAETTWNHLRDRGAIAVWNEKQLWLLRAIESFPTPFSLWRAQELASGNTTRPHGRPRGHSSN